MEEHLMLVLVLVVFGISYGIIVGVILVRYGIRIGSRLTISAQNNEPLDVKQLPKNLQEHTE